METYEFGDVVALDFPKEKEFESFRKAFGSRVKRFRKSKIGRAHV